MFYIDYTAAERLCICLAEELRNCLGAELPDSRFIAIPRGGLIVLGILAYILELSANQIVSTTVDPVTSPTVVVDDCSLSGARFARFLQDLPAETERVVFVHLASHPALRRAIQEQEARVIHCLAATNLHEKSDVTQSMRPWGKRFIETFPTKRYWLGRVQAVYFAWSEPDRNIWNQHTQQFERWHIAIPRHCLDARTALGVPLTSREPGNISVPDYLSWRIKADGIQLLRRDDGRVFGLPGSAGDMWRALAAYGDIEQAANYLNKLYDVAPEQLLIDLHTFTEQLISQGLLEDHASGGQPRT